jgi:hypothetical protein
VARRRDPRGVPAPDGARAIRTRSRSTAVNGPLSNLEGFREAVPSARPARPWCARARTAASVVSRACGTAAMLGRGAARASARSVAANTEVHSWLDHTERRGRRPRNAQARTR